MRFNFKILVYFRLELVYKRYVLFFSRIRPENNLAALNTG
jgi:hypothetical protein